MKKPILICLLAFICLNSIAQDSFRGLIGYSYSTINNNGSERKVNSPLYIIYNQSFCQLSVNGIINNFKVDSYSKQLNQGNIEESFISDETNTKPRGFYSINILHDKAGKSQLTINMPFIPDGAAYFVSDAKVYSQNWPVTGHPYVNNWKDVEKQAKINDSLSIAKQLTVKQNTIKVHKSDSIWQVNLANNKIKSADSILNIGNNYNNSSSKHIVKIIDSAFNMQITDKYIYGNIKVFIDGTGNIISCSKGKVADNIGDFIPQLNDLLTTLKLKVDPFVKDGVNYPSYSELFIEIDPQAYNYYKNKKQ